MNREQAARLLLDEPAKVAALVGFDKLGPLHNEWIKDMVSGKEDRTLQSHRGSYKTTCVSFALSNIIVLLPRVRTFFLRKTGDDVKEVLRQVDKILSSPYYRYLVQCIYGTDLQFMISNTGEIDTNLNIDSRGTSQLTAQGLKGSITGKHFDRIFTDDIVNTDDRRSRAEREATKLVYQELQNIRNKGGRIFNTGTPWHPDDAFMLMPEAEKFDCYSTGILTQENLEELRASMLPSLFAANYELRHIASEDVIFFNPQKGADLAMVQQGEGHIDAAYGGEDYTAYTACNVRGGKYYIYGRLWHKHVDDVLDQILKIHQDLLLGRLYAEKNGDKGYLVRDIRVKSNVRAMAYNETMNKHLKITSYLKAAWKDVIFVEGTDDAYINQICDYTEEAEHDDAPDSAASLIRQFWKRKVQQL